MANTATPRLVYGLGYYEHGITGAFFVFVRTIGQKALPAMTDAGPFETPEAAMIEMSKYERLMATRGIPCIKLGNAPKAAMQMRSTAAHD